MWNVHIPSHAKTKVSWLKFTNNEKPMTLFYLSLAWFGSVCAYVLIFFGADCCNMPRANAQNSYVLVTTDLFVRHSKMCERAIQRSKQRNWGKNILSSTDKICFDNNSEELTDPESIFWNDHSLLWSIRMLITVIAPHRYLNYGWSWALDYKEGNRAMARMAVNITNFIPYIWRTLQTLLGCAILGNAWSIKS